MDRSLLIQRFRAQMADGFQALTLALCSWIYPYSMAAPFGLGGEPRRAVGMPLMLHSLRFHVEALLHLLWWNGARSAYTVELQSSCGIVRCAAKCCSVGSVGKDGHCRINFVPSVGRISSKAIAWCIHEAMYVHEILRAVLCCRTVSPHSSFGLWGGCECALGMRHTYTHISIQ